jgi:hypothetical protein
MFRSASARDEVHIHLQGMVDRTTRVFCRVIDGQEEFLRPSTASMAASMVMNAAGELTQTVNEVRMDSVSPICGPY